MRRRICTICARGGSKGVKDKNLRTIAGKPLLAHTIGQVRASNLFEVVAASSDSPAILDVAMDHGADLRIPRSAELATDEAGKLPAVRHCVLEAERVLGVTFEVVVDVDVTAPLRLAEDIVGAVELLETGGSGTSNVITAAPARKSPYFNMVELDENQVPRLVKPPPKAVLSRQASPAVYDMNASVYVWWRDRFIEEPELFTDETALYVMPEERSIDIDTDFDFELAEYLLAKRTAA